MKKILFIHHTGFLGGASVSLFNVVKILSTSYKIVVYCPSEPSTFQEYLINKGVNVICYGTQLPSLHYYSCGPSIASPIFIKNMFNIFRFFKYWENVIALEKPDIVICNSKVLSWFSSITLEAKIPSICFIRETRKCSLLNIFNTIHKYYLEKFNGVVFISEYDKKVESLKLTKSIVVPNFINFNEYLQKNNKKYILKELRIPEDNFNILYVGGLLSFKGYDIAVKSLKYLSNYKISLIIAGEDKQNYAYRKDIFRYLKGVKSIYKEKLLKYYMKKYNLESKIVRVGIVKDMADMYTIADVLIFPSKCPHQARPVFEAGVQKVPVIMPDFSNTLEYVSDMENGLIFKRNNPKDLAKKIQILIDDRKLAKSLGDSNYIKSLKNHSTKNSSDLLIPFVEQFISK